MRQRGCNYFWFCSNCALYGVWLHYLKEAHRIQDQLALSRFLTKGTMKRPYIAIEVCCVELHLSLLRNQFGKCWGHAWPIHLTFFCIGLRACHCFCPWRFNKVLYYYEKTYIANILDQYEQCNYEMGFSGGLSCLGGLLLPNLWYFLIWKFRPCLVV